MHGTTGHQREVGIVSSVYRIVSSLLSATRIANVYTRGVEYTLDTKTSIFTHSSDSTCGTYKWRSSNNATHK